MPILTDMCGHDVEITQSYIGYRNRLIDVHLIHTFQAKGKKVLINTYKQNDHVPTMCIFFENKEKAVEAYQVMKDLYYGSTQTQIQTHALVKSMPPEMEFSWEILLAVSPMLLLFFYLFSKHFFPLE